MLQVLGRHVLLDIPIVHLRVEHCRLITAVLAAYVEGLCRATADFNRPAILDIGSLGA